MTTDLVLAVRVQCVLQCASQLRLVVHVHREDVRLPDELLGVRVLTRQLQQNHQQNHQTKPWLFLTMLTLTEKE